MTAEYGPRTETLTNVPSERVEDIVSRFRADGAAKISREEQPDGSWTVTAEFSQEPVGKAG